jgi:hypothetical protein
MTADAVMEVAHEKNPLSFRCPYYDSDIVLLRSEAKSVD